MPWIRMLADHDWKPKPAVTVAYKAGETYNVTRACAAEAIEAGRAEKTSKPMVAPTEEPADGDA